MSGNIVIGCDNAAVRLKNTLAEFLRANGAEVEDTGCHSEADETYYPWIAQKVCEEIIRSGYRKRGVLICGTGIGMSITANKFKGIRAALCHDSYSAERAVLSNGSNVLCLGERVIGPELAKKILREWISLEFQDGPSSPKVEAIREIENQRLK